MTNSVFRRLRGALRARLGSRGVVAVEYAILLPVFLLFVLGIMDMGRLLWTQVTLDRFVQQAARCAVITPSTCGTAAQIQTFAVTTNYGMSFSDAAFTLASPTTCGTVAGKLVTVSKPFQFSAPLISPSLTLGAQACYPTPPAS